MAKRTRVRTAKEMLGSLVKASSPSVRGPRPKALALAEGGEASKGSGSVFSVGSRASPGLTSAEERAARKAAFDAARARTEEKKAASMLAEVSAPPVEQRTLKDVQSELYGTPVRSLKDAPKTGAALDLSLLPSGPAPQPGQYPSDFVGPVPSGSTVVEPSIQRAPVLKSKTVTPTKAPVVEPKKVVDPVRPRTPPTQPPPPVTPPPVTPPPGERDMARGPSTTTPGGPPDNSGNWRRAAPGEFGHFGIGLPGEMRDGYIRIGGESQIPPVTPPPAPAPETGSQTRRGGFSRFNPAGPSPTPPVTQPPVAPPPVAPPPVAPPPVAPPPVAPLPVAPLPVAPPPVAPPPTIPFPSIPSFPRTPSPLPSLPRIFNPAPGQVPGTVPIAPPIGHSPIPTALDLINQNPNLQPRLMGNVGFMTDRLGNRIYAPGMPSPVQTYAEGGDVQPIFQSEKIPGSDLPGEDVRANVLGFINRMDDGAVMMTASKLTGLPFDTPTQARVALEKMFGDVNVTAGVMASGSRVPDRVSGYSVGAGFPFMGGRLQGQLDFPPGGRPNPSLSFSKKFAEGGNVSRETLSSLFARDPRSSLPDMARLSDSSALTAMPKIAEPRREDTARARLDDMLRQLKIRERSVQDATRGLGRDTMGAPTLEQPTLAKSGVARRRFEEGGEVKKSQEVEGVDGPSASKLLRRLALAVARGVPQAVTGFVDLAALPLTATGRMKAEDVFGTTDYLTNRGLLPPPQEGLASESAELLSSMASPGGAAKAAVLGMVGSKGVIIPSKISDLKNLVLQREGGYGAKRVERAADEIRNLEKLFTEEALRDAFTGDNAKAVVTMNPSDFEKYAKQLKGRTNADIGPKMAELAKQGEIDKYTIPTDEYIQHLMRIQGGFDQVPYLNLFKDEVGLPTKPEIRGHEGRHRSRALSELGESTTLVDIAPRGDLREGLPRRSREEYIQALREELGLSDRLVLPEAEGSLRRPAIQFPEPYASGGEVNKHDAFISRNMQTGGEARSMDLGPYEGTYRYSSTPESASTQNAQAKLAAELMKVHFPDMLASNEAVVRAGTPAVPRALGVFDSDTNEITMRPEEPRLSFFEKNPRFPNDPGYIGASQVPTTEDVLNRLGVLAHEGYHARTTGRGTGYLTRQGWDDVIELMGRKRANEFAKDLGEAKFPSVGIKGQSSAKRTEEFLATVVPMKQMEERGFLSEGWKRFKPEYERLAKKYPEIEQVVGMWKQPESRPNVGLMQRLKEKVNEPLSALGLAHGGPVNKTHA